MKYTPDEIAALLVSVSAGALEAEDRDSWKFSEVRTA
jgi:hypothetical protein